VTLPRYTVVGGLGEGWQTIRIRSNPILDMPDGRYLMEGSLGMRSRASLVCRTEPSFGAAAPHQAVRTSNKDNIATSNKMSRVGSGCREPVWHTKVEGG
jgi:hypothetical protein